MDLQYDIPSVCAQKVIDGTVDIGLIPVAVLPLLKDSFIISKFCLGSNGQVDTVKLYSAVPLEEIETVALDYQSRTSVTLVQVLSKFYWNISPNFAQAKEGFEKNISGKNAAVVIGDRCFDMNGHFAYEYDLAAEWKKYTGLPFVFAAWISNKPIDPEFVKEFEKALSYGVEHTHEAVSKNIPPARHGLIHQYLTQRISYDLDKEKQQSMQHFLHLLKEL
jgi:chorismate dehydratase